MKPFSATINHYVYKTYVKNAYTDTEVIVLEPSTDSPEYNITAVDTGDETFTIAGDHVSEFYNGNTFVVAGSTGNDGDWTVASAVLDTGNTVITVTGDITNAVADGTIQATAIDNYTPGRHYMIRQIAADTVSADLTVEEGVWDETLANGSGAWVWTAVFVITPGTDMFILDPDVPAAQNYRITATGADNLNVSYEYR